MLSSLGRVTCHLVTSSISGSVCSIFSSLESAPCAIVAGVLAPYEFWKLSVLTQQLHRCGCRARNEGQKKQTPALRMPSGCHVHPHGRVTASVDFSIRCIWSNTSNYPHACCRVGRSIALSQSANDVLVKDINDDRMKTEFIRQCPPCQVMNHMRLQIKAHRFPLHVL